MGLLKKHKTIGIIVAAGLVLTVSMYFKFDTLKEAFLNKLIDKKCSYAFEAQRKTFKGLSVAEEFKMTDLADTCNAKKLFDLKSFSEMKQKLCPSYNGESASMCFKSFVKGQRSISYISFSFQSIIGLTVPKMKKFSDIKNSELSQLQALDNMIYVFEHFKIEEDPFYQKYDKIFNSKGFEKDSANEFVKNGDVIWLHLRQKLFWDSYQKALKTLNKSITKHKSRRSLASDSRYKEHMKNLEDRYAKLIEYKHRGFDENIELQANLKSLEGQSNTRNR